MLALFASDDEAHWATAYDKITEDIHVFNVCVGSGLLAVEKYTVRSVMNWPVMRVVRAVYEQLPAVGTKRILHQWRKPLFGFMGQSEINEKANRLAKAVQVQDRASNEVKRVRRWSCQVSDQLAGDYARPEVEVSTDSPVPKKPPEEWFRVSEAQKEPETLNYAKIN